MFGRIKALCATLLLAMLVVFHAGPAAAGGGSGLARQQVVR